MSSQRDARSVTLRDVAQAADVHPSTASRALDARTASRLRPETVQRVKAVARQLGYVPDMLAKGLTRGTAAMVGVVVGRLEDPYIGPVIRGISDELERRELAAIVAETRDDHARLEHTLSNLLGRRVDAIVLTGGQLNDVHLLARFARRVRAIVLAVQNVPGVGLPYVTHDDAHGAELAARHLIELGHTTLAQLRGASRSDPMVRRAEAFRRTVGAAGMVDVTVSETAMALTPSEGRRLMALTLDGNSMNPPTAVWAHTDLMALGALQEVKRRGLRCPEDISIIGYDDAPLLEYVDPPLSTIALPGAEIGRVAAEIAIQLMDEPDSEPRSVSLMPTLIPRESTAHPPVRSSPTREGR